MSARCTGLPETAGHLWGSRDYLQYADLAYEAVKRDIDSFGILRHVAGCPDFNSEGTSAEAQAAFIMASAWKLRELGSYKEFR